MMPAAFKINEMTVIETLADCHHHKWLSLHACRKTILMPSTLVSYHAQVPAHCMAL